MRVIAQRMIAATIASLRPDGKDEGFAPATEPVTTGAHSAGYHYLFTKITLIRSPRAVSLYERKQRLANLQSATR